MVNKDYHCMFIRHSTIIQVITM